MATQYTAGITYGQVWSADIANTIGAAWESWTPQLWQGANVTSSVTYSRYGRVNKFVYCVAYISPTAGGTSGQQIEIRNIPIAAANLNSFAGSFTYLDAGVAWYAGSIVGITTTSVSFYVNNSPNYFGAGFAVANTDAFRFGFYYEAA